jgi:cyclophilin family peptidyl-prolyl cis-trans isomerase
MFASVFFRGKVLNIAVLETNKGIIEIELLYDNAPITVENFKTYLEEGFFDGLIFHRVIKDFMIQGGGFFPNATYKEPTHEPIQNEARNGLKNLNGTIAMARNFDPNSATSQFFINTGNNVGLDFPNPDGFGYTVFGNVIKGMKVVEKIESMPVGKKITPYGALENWPIEDIIIIKAYLKTE